MELTLSDNGDGSITGRLGADGEWAPVSGTVENDLPTDTIDMQVFKAPFQARLAGNQIEITLSDEGDSESYILHRSGTDAAEAEIAGAAAADTEEWNPPVGERNVIINGQKLSDEELAMLEQTYRVRIMDAEYWHDSCLRRLGNPGRTVRGFHSSGTGDRRFLTRGCSGPHRSAPDFRPAFGVREMGRAIRPVCPTDVEKRRGRRSSYRAGQASRHRPELLRRGTRAGPDNSDRCG